MTRDEAVDKCRAAQRAEWLRLGYNARKATPDTEFAVFEAVAMIEALGVIKFDAARDAPVEIGDGTNPDKLPPRLYAKATHHQHMSMFDTATVVAALAEIGFEIRRKA